MPARSSRSSSMPGILCPPACLSSGHSIKSSFPCNRVVSLPPPALFPLFHPGFLSFTPFYPALLGVSLLFTHFPLFSCPLLLCLVRHIITAPSFYSLRKLSTRKCSPHMKAKPTEALFWAISDHTKTPVQPVTAPVDIGQRLHCFRGSSP